MWCAESSCVVHFSELVMSESLKQAHIEEIKKTHDQAERSKDKRHKALLAGLKRQADAQMEELTLLRRIRDRQLSSSDVSDGGLSPSSGGGGLLSPLRRSSRDLVMSQLCEEDEEEEEEEVGGIKAVVRSSQAMVATPQAIAITNEVTTVSNNEMRRKPTVLVLITILFGLFAILVFQHGISSVADFRAILLRPLVLRLAQWLSDA